MAKKKTAKKSSKITYVKICPNCGSVQIKNSQNEDAPETFVCQKCKYKSILFPEIDKSKSNYFKEHIINKRHEHPISDIIYGHYEPTGIVKLSGPIMFFLGILMLLMLQNYYVPIIYPMIIILLGIILSYVAFIGGRH